MATLKRRLYRKNSSGTYDTVYLETSADLITGSVAIAHGGTGATTAANARSNLGITPANIGAAVSSHNHSASNITSGTLPVARGGTGVTSLDALKNALGISDDGGSLNFEIIKGVNLQTYETSSYSITKYRDYNYMQIMVYYFNHNSPSWNVSVSPIYNLKNLIACITESLSSSPTYGDVRGGIYTTNILYNGSPQEIIESSSLSLKFSYDKTSVPYVKSIVIEVNGGSRVVFDIMLMK